MGLSCKRLCLYVNRREKYGWARISLDPLICLGTLEGENNISMMAVAMIVGLESRPHAKYNYVGEIHLSGSLEIWQETACVISARINSLSPKVAEKGNLTQASSWHFIYSCLITYTTHNSL